MKSAQLAQSDTAAPVVAGMGHGALGHGGQTIEQEQEHVLPILPAKERPRRASSVWRPPSLADVTSVTSAD